MPQQDVLTTALAEAQAVHLYLTRDRWEASCPDCGYTLAWAIEQEVLDGMVARATLCPVCGWTG
jgi:hypothetical protein